MKIQVASDLHLEFLRRVPAPALPLVPAPDADVLVLAGDIDSHTHMLDTFADWPVPVIYVNGNHEAYDAHYFGIQEQLRAKAEGTSVRYLEQDVFIVGDVRFLGCCLWTDYNLEGNPMAAMAIAKRAMNDHELIRVAKGDPFWPSLALRVHQKSVAWLNEQLAKPFAGKTVVVTHHAPHPKSIAPKYRGSELNPAFASDLTAVVKKVDLWIHGHTHSSVDYHVGKCRVVANPFGYPRQVGAGCVGENLDFNPFLVLPL